MTDFEKRLAPGQAAEAEAWSRLEKSGWCVAKNGTEHTHPDFVAKLRGNNSPAALFVRFAPDGVIHRNNQVVHCDVKVGKSIEKSAWETYMKYHEAGCFVVLFVKHENDWFWQWVEKVQLVDGSKSIEKFPENKRFPVDKDGWICPRKTSRNVCNEKMSGTPYRYIDMASLNKWICD